MELKPCPFCGGEAVVAWAHPPFMLKRLHNRFIFAGCKKCHVSTPLFNARNKTGSPLINEAHTKDAKKKAIEAWNRRATDESSNVKHTP